MKKVLSFVLSVAMVICLMPSLAFAADDAADTTATATATGLSQFSDADSIQNKEAVAVLVGLGIIDGMGDGTFQPAGNLTRAQASKLVATLVKSGDKSEIPAPAADPFTDVAKSYWGAGAIKFGVDNGYINGMGDGTFHPEDQVTTAQLATMLDKLLGYSVADINYQWPENAMAKATTAGLLKGVTKGASDNLNREEAAQMIFNALEANTKVKSTTTGSDSQLVDGGSGYENVPNKESDDYRTNGKDTHEQLIEKYFPKAVYDNSKTASGDVFGRPATVWKSGRTKITDEIIQEPVLTYTTREVDADKPDTKASEKLYSDLEGYIADEAEVVVNGKTVTKVNVEEDEEGNKIEKEVPDTITSTDSDTIADIIAPRTGNGVLVELYSNDKGTEITKVIVIDYDVDTVTRVDSETGEIELKANGKITKKADFYAAVSSVSVDDYILVAKNGNKIVDAYLPKTVEKAAVTKIVNETLKGREDEVATIGGTEYAVGHDGVADLTRNPEDEGTAYLDQYDFLVAYEKAKAEASDWALLESVYTTSANNEVGEKSTDWYGILVKEDGTTLNVPLMGATDTKSDKYDANTLDTINTFKAGLVPDGENYFKLAGTLVTYKEAAGGYKLNTAKVKSDGIEDTANTVVAPSQKNADGQVVISDKTTRIGDKYLSQDLKVITVSGEKASSLKVKTDFKINKTIANGQYKYVWKTVGNNDLVTAIYVTGAAKDSTTIKVTKVVGPTTYDSTKKGIEIKYYTDDNSAEQTGIVEEDAKVSNGGWYTVEEFKDGMKVNELDKSKYVDKDIEFKSNASAYGNSMTIDGTEYEFASEASVVDLDKTGIDSAEALVDRIAKITKKDGTTPVHISFTWEEDNDKKVVSQVYVEKVATSGIPSSESNGKK